MGDGHTLSTRDRDDRPRPGPLTRCEEQKLRNKANFAQPLPLLEDTLYVKREYTTNPGRRKGAFQQGV